MTKETTSEQEIKLPKRTLKVEFYVGLFVIVGLLCFAYLSINIAGMKFFNSGSYQVLAEFDNISGLEKGASVEIAGVHVGEVSNISLKNFVALVTIDIDNSVKIYDEDIAAIRTKGIIGDRYIKIIRGGSETSIKPGNKLTDTESAVEFEEIIGKFIHKIG